MPYLLTNSAMASEAKIAVEGTVMRSLRTVAQPLRGNESKAFSDLPVPLDLRKLPVLYRTAVEHVFLLISQLRKGRCLSCIRFLYFFRFQVFGNWETKPFFFLGLLSH